MLNHSRHGAPLSKQQGNPQLEAAPGCPRARIPGGLLSTNGEIALGYLEVGYRPIPLIQDGKGSWVPAVKWTRFQHRPPARRHSGEISPRPRPRMPFPPASATSPQGNLCDLLSQALGRDIHPGTTITPFCHSDEVPSLAICSDHAYCFSQKRWFSLHPVPGQRHTSVVPAVAGAFSSLPLRWIHMTGAASVISQYRIGPKQNNLLGGVT